MTGPCLENRFDQARMACGGWARQPCRIWPLPFDSGAVLVAPGASVNVPASPQYDFFGELLVVASDISPFWTIDNITVGTAGQLIANGSQLATVYAETSQNNILNLDAAGPGRLVTLSVTNISAVAQRFRATLFGVVKKDS